MTLQVAILALAAAAAAACGTTFQDRAPIVVGSQLEPAEIESIQEHCATVAHCLQERLGWAMPSRYTVKLVPRLADHVPLASRYAVGYAERTSATIVIETGTWAKRPEVLWHELAHLALPDPASSITEPLEEGLVNVAAMLCAPSPNEKDRLHVQSVIAVLNATGGIAFEVSWQGPDGGVERADISFRPKDAGAYLARHPDDHDSLSLDEDGGIVHRTTRDMVATFVVATFEREHGIAATMQAILDVSHTADSDRPELQLAARCGMASTADLRRAAISSIDQRELVQVVLHEAQWLYSRLGHLGVHLRHGVTPEGPAETLRISLEGSSVAVSASELSRATSVFGR